MKSHMLRTVCLSALCAGLVGQVYATDYEYVYEGPVTIALTITRQLPDTVVQNGETTITTWKTQTTKFTNKEYIKIIVDYLELDIDVAKAKLMQTGFIETDGVLPLFIRYGNMDIMVPDEIGLWYGWTGAYNGKETETNISRSGSESGKEIVHCEILGMDLFGVSTYKSSWSENDETGSDNWSDSVAAKVSGQNDYKDVIEGTISFSTKTIKKAIAGP